jgi:ribonuclease H2 subunit C
MFAIQSQKSRESDDSPPNTCTPNILPCRIHHDGPVDSLERYWTPLPNEQSTTRPTIAPSRH